MSPEQLRGEKASFASDIYGLGATLFHMTTGRLPFEGNHPLDIATRRLSEDAPSPRLFAPDVSRSLEFTIVRCLAADTRLRPSSVMEVGKMLESPPPVLWGRRRFVRGAAGVAAASVAGATGWAIFGARHPVAVELFEIDNPTHDPALDYIASGMSRELLRRFTYVKNATVIPAHATLTAGAPSGRADLALSGTLQPGAAPANPNGFALRIRLDDSKTRRVVWSQVFERARFSGVLEMQEEVSKQSAIHLEHHVLASRATALAALVDWLPGSSSLGEQPTRSSAAFDLYMRGSNLLQEASPESVRAAVEFLERAVAEDSHFALAFAALSEAHQALLDFGHDKNSASSAAARDYAIRALREDPSLAEAHAVMAAVNQLDWNWAGAESEYDRALQLKPRFPKAIRWRAGLVLQFERFDEAIAGFEESRRLDPYDRSAVSGHGLALIFAGRFRDAIAFLEREIGDRDMAPARNNLIIALGLLAKRSQSEDSEQSFQKAFDQANALAAIERRAPTGASEKSDFAYAWLHSLRLQPQQAAPYLERLERDVEAGLTSPILVVPPYVAQGRYEEAIVALERTVFLRDRSVMNMRVNTLTSELRGMPRFEALLRTVRLK
jgi:tetratricopeptide (TPR) repeat protein/TolB-like protein